MVLSMVFVWRSLLICSGPVGSLDVSISYLFLDCQQQKNHTNKLSFMLHKSYVTREPPKDSPTNLQTLDPKQTAESSKPVPYPVWRVIK